MTQSDIQYYISLIPQLKILKQINPRLASIVIKYFNDMRKVFINMEKCLHNDGKIVIVCGDNLVGGMRIQTWDILRKIIKAQGFEPYDQYRDKIENRILPPKRSGHKGLIKEEVVCAYAKKGL